MMALFQRVAARSSVPIAPDRRLAAWRLEGGCKPDLARVEVARGGTVGGVGPRGESTSYAHRTSGWLCRLASCRARRAKWRGVTARTLALCLSFGRRVVVRLVDAVARRLFSTRLATVGLVIVACGPADAVGPGGTRAPASTRACPQPMTGPLNDPGSTEALRCDQLEAPARDAVSVDGTVLGEVLEPGHPGQPLADTAVTLHAVAKGPAGGLGQTLARTTTDPQGHFHLSLQLEPGEYFVAARAETEGAVLTMVRVTLSPHGPRQISDVRLWVPVDPRLRSGAAPGN